MLHLRQNSVEMNIVELLVEFTPYWVNYTDMQISNNTIFGPINSFFFHFLFIIQTKTDLLNSHNLMYGKRYIMYNNDKIRKRSATSIESQNKIKSKIDKLKTEIHIQAHQVVVIIDWFSIFILDSYSIIS